MTGESLEGGRWLFGLEKEAPPDEQTASSMRAVNSSKFFCMACISS